MKKDDTFWNPEDIYLLITEDYRGYLALNYNDDWKYLNFGDGELLENNPPQDIIMSFNEIECLGVWHE